MSKITIEMNEHKEFFSSKLGQSVLNEMAKSDCLETIVAVINCSYTSKDVLAHIVKRLTLVEVEKYNNYDAFCVVAQVAKNRQTDAITLEAIYDFASGLIASYQVTSNEYNIGRSMLRYIAVHPNTSEHVLRKLVAKSDSFIELVVRNQGISDEWLISLTSEAKSQAEKLAAVPELVRRLKEKL